MMPQNEQSKPTYEELKKSSRRLKKYLLITVGGVLLLTLVTVAVVLLINGRQEKPMDDKKYYFYPTYEGDILKNESYLKLNREISYCEDANGYGLTQTVTEELYGEMDVSAQLVCTYLKTVIAGDETDYNDLFASAYLGENGRQADFSPQMLYDMTFYLYDQKAGDSGAKIYTYKLHYKIYRNDGTFRRDVGSDMIRPQFLIITVNRDGTAKISDMAFYKVSGNVDLE